MPVSRSAAQTCQLSHLSHCQEASLSNRSQGHSDSVTVELTAVREFVLEHVDHGLHLLIWSSVAQCIKMISKICTSSKYTIRLLYISTYSTIIYIYLTFDFVVVEPKVASPVKVCKLTDLSSAEHIQTVSQVKALLQWQQITYCLLGYYCEVDFCNCSYPEKIRKQFLIVTW